MTTLSCYGDTCDGHSYGDVVIDTTAAMSVVMATAVMTMTAVHAVRIKDNIVEDDDSCNEGSRHHADDSCMNI